MSKKLIAADLSNIEGRGLAFLAGEEWKLDAFRAYDKGAGPDLYNITATSIIGGDPYRVKKKDRNVFGKVPDLALGYEGGVGALQQFATAYGVRMAEQWPSIEANVAKQHRDKALNNYTYWGKPKAEEISKKEWVASEAVKLAWRARHPATVQLWADVKEAAYNAVRAPGETFTAGQHIRMAVKHKAGIAYLIVRMPGGRYLCYNRPKIVGEGRDEKLMYWGQSRKAPSAPPIWGKVFTYGGKMVENITQSFSRDVLAYNMQPAEDAGYQIVLTVHDEIVAESDHGSAEELSAIMATVPPWAKGLPLSAEGFEAKRYKKD